MSPRCYRGSESRGSRHHRETAARGRGREYRPTSAARIRDVLDDWAKGQRWDTRNRSRETRLTLLMCTSAEHRLRSLRSRVVVRFDFRAFPRDDAVQEWMIRDVMERSVHEDAGFDVDSWSPPMPAPCASVDGALTFAREGARGGRAEGQRDLVPGVSTGCGEHFAASRGPHPSATRSPRRLTTIVTGTAHLTVPARDCRQVFNCMRAESARHRRRRRRGGRAREAPPGRNAAPFETRATPDARRLAYSNPHRARTGRRRPGKDVAAAVARAAGISGSGATGRCGGWRESGSVRINPHAVVVSGPVPEESASALYAALERSACQPAEISVR